MNTSLRDARIFDEDFADAANYKWFTNPFIKKEPVNDSFKSETKTIVKTEVKQELFDEETNFPVNGIDFGRVTIKQEVLDELTSPMKTDFYENSDSNSRKSFKSTKINSYNKRDSPYKTERLGFTSENVSKLRFECSSSKTVTAKGKKKELEIDPDILQRRQKQIDYGKNTVGYDRYISLVPKNERKTDDPQTPNKYIKYSRRGFDGLIKQWRLRLHKYDPEGTA